MMIVFTHTDFRIYWPPRLMRLREFLESHDCDLQVIEISGAGSPYAFAGNTNHNPVSWWHCLFPDRAMEQISSFEANRTLMRELDRLQPDIVFSGAIAYPSGAASVVWTRSNRKSVVIFDNVRRLDVPRNGLINAFKRRIYANVDAVFLPAPSHAADYEYWGMSPERMFYGLNVVDNDFWLKASNEAGLDKWKLRAQSGLPENFFLGVGRQVSKKNWVRLLHAYRQYRNVVTHDHPWGLVLVGNGPDRQALETLINQEAIPEATLIDFLNPAELAKIYSLASALILPSFYGETWGLVANEAMCCGLPVLISNHCGCARTLVTEGMNGWTFDPYRQDRLAELMLRLASQPPESLAQMGRASREMIADWSLDRFCAGVWEAIQSCRDGNRGFASPLDRLLLPLWLGRYRPT